MLLLVIAGTIGASATPGAAAVEPLAAPGPGVNATNLALGRPATADSTCNANEGPEKAVNGSVAGGNSDKWCSTGGSKFLQIDLGSAQSIQSFTVRHASAGGEPAYYNTKDFDVLVSANGSTWSTVVTARGNTAAVSNHPLSSAVNGRFVRLNVITPTQMADQAARIYELEVYGAGGPPPPPPPPPPPGQTPVAANGQLRVCGNRLCNKNGKQIQLRGMSTHGLQWFSQCNNAASLDALAGDWTGDALRISMYIQEGGYETDPVGFTNRVHSLIEMATARGIYAIVDWHQLTPGDPNFNLARARTFFTQIAQRHGNKPNILYEVANEPNGVGWQAIKSYHEQIIPVIRAQDPDSVILLGTRAWSSLGISDGSNENEVINNQVNASNVMYTFHFYAASHGAAYRNALSNAADRIPMFVTEFGTQQASGDGGNDFNNSQQYINLMAQKKISWINWNFSDDFRSGAVFTTGTCPNGPFGGTSRLKPAGVWIRERMKTPDDF